MNVRIQTNRRDFLKTSMLGAMALTGSWGLPRLLGAEPAPRAAFTSRVALTAGGDRAELAFQGLKQFEKQIAAAIGNKRVIIKPNNVSIENQLSASHADNLAGILEFLKSIGKKDVAIAESAASGPTLDGFANYGYNQVAAKYGAKLMDLDQEGFEVLHCFDETDFRPHSCRMSKVLLDPNNFIISAAKFKTHDRVVATLSLKNIVVGAPIKDAGFTWGPGGKAGAKNDKPLTHGSGFRGINYNLFALAPRLHPHLAVIDGFEGMEGEGPVSRHARPTPRLRGQPGLAGRRPRGGRIDGDRFRQRGVLEFLRAGRDGRGGLGQSRDPRAGDQGPHQALQTGQEPRPTVDLETKGWPRVAARQAGHPWHNPGARIKAPLALSTHCRQRW